MPVPEWIVDRILIAADLGVRGQSETQQGVCKIHGALNYLGNLIKQFEIAP
jgi:hypothetical protein